VLRHGVAPLLEIAPGRPLRCDGHPERRARSVVEDCKPWRPADPAHAAAGPRPATSALTVATINIVFVHARKRDMSRASSLKVGGRYQVRAAANAADAISRSCRSACPVVGPAEHRRPGQSAAVLGQPGLSGDATRPTISPATEHIQSALSRAKQVHRFVPSINRIPTVSLDSRTSEAQSSAIDAQQQPESVQHGPVNVGIWDAGTPFVLYKETQAMCQISGPV